jgi:phosphate transport system substrate-binding protein
MLKKWRIAFILISLAMLSVLIAACGASTGGGTASNSTPAPTVNTSGIDCVSGTLNTGGSTALGPLVQAAAKAYQSACSGANITTQLTGSTAGLTGAEAGSLNIGNSDNFATKAKYPDLTDNQVAVVIFTLMISKDVTNVTNLTTAQVQAIYSGKDTNWKQVGGPDLPISVISRASGSGTRNTFEKYVLGTTETVSGASHTTASTSGAVATDIQNKTGAIAYDTIHFANENNLTTVSIDGQAPTAAAVKTNAYKFWNIEHMYTKGAPTGLAKSFIDYIKGASAATLRQSNGFLDLSAVDASAITAKTPAS